MSWSQLSRRAHRGESAFSRALIEEDSLERIDTSQAHWRLRSAIANHELKCSLDASHKPQHYANSVADYHNNNNNNHLTQTQNQYRHPQVRQDATSESEQFRGQQAALQGAQHYERQVKSNRLPVLAAQMQPVELKLNASRDEHLYCDLNTMRADQRTPQQQTPLAHYKSDQLEQSFHTLIHKMNERHFYQLNSSPSFELRSQFGSTNKHNVGRYSAGNSSSSALDSDFERPVERAPYKRASERHKLARLFRFGRPLCLLIGLLSITLAALCLAALLSGFRQQQPASERSVELAAPRRVPGQHIVSVHFANTNPPADLATITIAQTTTTTTTTPTPLEASTQSYWLRGDEFELEERCGSPLGEQCSARGRCQAGVCLCFAGFSGPTCNIAKCPNECSQRGECRLLQGSAINNLGAGVASERASQTDSLGFQSLFGSLARNSLCPDWLEAELNQSWAVRPSSSADSEQLAVFDQRLEWRCNCRAGFQGADCSEPVELECNNERDDDHDGLIDCEDVDDCCAQPVCRDNLMCLKSPEPSKVLAARTWQTDWQDLLADAPSGLSSLPTGRSQAEAFFARVRFLLGNKSVQMYAQENLLDRSRVAVVRGKVVKPHLLAFETSAPQPTSDAAAERPFVGVRVESKLAFGTIGITFTRNDGSFDLIVNGDEWVTLQFHKNAHLSIKRKLFVRAHSFNLLDEAVEMWPIAASATVDPINRLRPDSNPFNLRLHAELYKLLAFTMKRDDERKRAAMFECLLDGLSPATQSANFLASNLFEPMLVDASSEQNASSEPLHFIATLGAGAFKTKLDELNAEEHLEIGYNSALFPPAASVSKATVSLRLLSQHLSQLYSPLSAVVIQLDIEGQSRRERLAPLAALSYQFAWNRRNVYDQKVYGFGELNIRVGYEYQLKQEPDKSLGVVWNECSARHQTQQVDLSESSLLKFSNALAGADNRVVWFRRKVYLEAHHLNQHSDIGKWSLLSSNRFDQERQVLYLGAGWSLPYKLAYPPVLATPIQLADDSNRIRANKNADERADASQQTVGRLLAKGPGSTMFVVLAQGVRSNSSRLVQLDVRSRQRLIDLPLAILTSRLETPVSRPTSFTDTFNKPHISDDLQLLYNNYASTLYVSSRLSAKIVQMSLASLLVLNKTLSSTSATANAEDEIDIEPLCGFGKQALSASSPMEAIKACRLIRLAGAHSLTLDEERQVLYFVDGSADIIALDLATNQAFSLAFLSRTSSRTIAKPHPPIVGRPLQCQRSELRRPFADYRAHYLHSLTWNRADSSLYFVDQNAVFAIRQDLNLELIALGAAANRPSNFPFSTSCFREPQLGLIKMLTADENSDDLLLVHQELEPNRANGAESKQSGRFYLAKLKTGIRSGPSEGLQPSQIVDLHSASATWNPMISRLASNSMQPNKTAIPNWKELAVGSQQFASASLSGHQLDGSKQTRERTVPFIHLSGGFERLDSIEIGADGSIFVLDSVTHSIRPIVAYSPNDFNLVERHNVNINRLFATNSEHLVLSQTQTARLKLVPTTNDKQEPPEAQKLSLLIVRNPISTDLMEFHSSSGLQLRLTSANGIKCDYYYDIIANNKMAEPDEDDKYDFASQHLMLGYMSIYNQSNRLAGAFIRLSKIVDASRQNEFELARVYTGSRYVLQSIVLNNQPICKLATDYMGVLSTYQQPNKQYWLEMVYDSLTYLLRDMITRADSTGALNADTSNKRDNPYNYNTNLSPYKNWRQLKRIVYDRVFYHYCDLFIVNS